MRSPARICGLRTCYACRQPLGRNQWHVVAVAVGVRGLCCTWLRGLDGSRGDSRPRHGWSGSDPCPSYLMVQLFFLDTRKRNRRHKSVRLPHLYFSSDLWL
ncbi:hypothetical protein BHM03_00040928 [Ensete ventricosum]|nr:hypothetical protein BHM03_00040928 [Ensete ventricosum]